MSSQEKKRVIFCGTHPAQFNGYSKVVYELCKNLLNNTDIELFVFGFQNFYKSEIHGKERVLENCEEIYDVYLQIKKNLNYKKIYQKMILFRQKENPDIEKLINYLNKIKNKCTFIK